MANSYNLSQWNFEKVWYDSCDVPKVNLERSLSDFPNWVFGMSAFCRCHGPHGLMLTRCCMNQYSNSTISDALLCKHCWALVSHTKHHHLQLYQHLSQTPSHPQLNMQINTICRIQVCPGLLALSSSLCAVTAVCHQTLSQRSKDIRDVHKHILLYLSS
jgi:hypothetical protein